MRWQVLRDVDGEFKVLEDVARTLGENRAATERINLFSELKACASCSGVIIRFGERYPEIQLNISTGK
ncbi:deaminase domain-containing protein [Stenotrophomonas maltophilia]|uniref:deaminase domain-containing protein n=1 Tax=Stenotrophomonas maltophilia TaxID=40324 RepID=UPI003D2F8FB5